MADPRIVFRAPSPDDIDAALQWYLSEAGEDSATRFLAELDAAFSHIAAHPGTGSPRWGQELGLPGLRHWGMRRFPFLVFYVEQPGRIEIVRVLHGSRDIPASLADPEA